MLLFEEMFGNYYKKLSENIKGAGGNTWKPVTFFHDYTPELLPAKNSWLTLNIAFSETDFRKSRVKVLNIQEYLDREGYYFSKLNLQLRGSTRKNANSTDLIMYIGGYPVEPFNANRPASTDTNTKVPTCCLEDLSYAPDTFVNYVELIKKFNEEVHTSLENNKLNQIKKERPEVIAERVLGQVDLDQLNALMDIRTYKLQTIPEATAKVNTAVSIRTGSNTPVSVDQWIELAIIAEQYYAPENVLDDEYHYAFERSPWEHWAVTDGNLIFANAATACRYYAQNLGLDETTEMKKGNILYNACENIDSKGHITRESPKMYGHAWRYATYNEIMNANNVDRIDAEMWYK